MIENLKALIVKTPFTQRQIAAFLKTNEARLSRIINGKEEATLTEMRIISGLVGMPVSDIWDITPIQILADSTQFIPN